MSSKLDKFLTIKPIWYKDRDKAQELQELEKAEKELEEKYFSIRTEESKCNPLGCTIKKASEKYAFNQDTEIEDTN